MGKTTSPSDTLNNIFTDIFNLQNVIEDLKKLQKTHTTVNYDDKQEVDNIFQATKKIIDILKAEISKVDHYFDTNYDKDAHSNDSEAAHVNNNNDEVLNVDESESLNNKENVECNDNNITSKVTDIEVNQTLEEEQLSDNNIEGADKENVLDEHIEHTEKENVIEEPKLFLKCVDINKLINPDILPLLTSPKPLPRNDCDDTVLIISDSEEEERKKKSAKRKTTSSRRKSKLVTRNFQHEKEEAASENFTHYTIRKSNSQASDNEIGVASVRSNLRKRTVKKKYQESSDSEYSSSESDVSVADTIQKTTRSKKLSVVNKNSEIDVNIVKDKKFFYKAYVPLPRIQCEKLKEYYLHQKDIADVQRLTNLKNMKKRRRRSSNSSLSSDTEKTSRTLKRKKSLSSASSSSDTDASKESTTSINLLDINVDNLQKGITSFTDKENQVTGNEEALCSLLNGITSDSDKEEKAADDEESQENEKKSNKDEKHSEMDEAVENEEKESDSKKDDEEINKDTNESENESRKEIEKDDHLSDQQSDEHKSENSEGDSSKRKKKTPSWRKDKLLIGKLMDTDSEDEFEKFKKESENAKSEVKARLKKRVKKVFNSDSESDEKKSSGEDNQQSSSSSSEAEQNTKKKRRRIKRVNDSSDEEDKTTRKTIRKVIAHQSLAESTKQAEKEEKERKLRILERQKKYNQIFDCDIPQDATIDKVVLDFNEETKEELLSVSKDLVSKLKPHQGKGVQFMWDACYESIERARTTDGSGCILAHCMGLGKTLQVIALTYTILTHADVKVSTVLVVCPLNTVLNWSSEYKKWLEDVAGPNIDVYDLATCKQNYREFIIDDWHKHGGVLIIGYDMFRNLTNPKNKRLKKKAKDSYQNGLVNPGPDVVICDEGHLLKNEKTNLSVAMNRIRTARRIVLTGTPMQNNLKEYYCMVQFVKPNLLGTYKEYINRFVNPITNGQYTDSTPHDINVMRKRSHVLHKLLDGVVQRKDYSVLTPFLPPKYEYVLFLTLTETQVKLYQYYKDNFSQRLDESKLKSSFLFADFQEFQRICTHPRVLLMKSIQERNKYTSDDEEEESEGSLKDFIDDNESEAKSTSSSSSNNSDCEEVSSKTEQVRLTRTAAAASGIDIDSVLSECKASTNNESTEWWNQFCTDADLDNIELSSKLFLVFNILQECELIGDKLLIFSQSLYSLNIIEYFLSKIDDATQSGDHSKVSGFSGSWTLGLDYFRLDGSSSCDNRLAWCKSFNNLDNPRARLFLISTKAGGLGINLVGANRVIVFDVSWNPSHDTQSIYRVYRFGQTKPCYIYRFAIWGAMEMKIYERQVTKQAISKRVIDEQQVDRHYNQTDLAELYNFDPVPTEQIIPLVPKDVLLAELLQKHKDRIYKYHEHQTLLENKEDEVLNEAERKAAWDEYENEKTVQVVVTDIGSIGDIPLPTIRMALMNLLQRDHPGWSREQVRHLLPLAIAQLKKQFDTGQTVLYDRVVAEVKQMQELQQARFQEYIRQQQQQQQLQVLEHFRNQVLQRGLGFPTNPNEVVELND